MITLTLFLAGLGYLYLPYSRFEGLIDYSLTPAPTLGAKFQQLELNYLTTIVKHVNDGLDNIRSKVG